MRDDYVVALQVYATFALHLSAKVIEQDLHATLIRVFLITHYYLQNSVLMSHVRKECKEFLFQASFFFSTI